MRILAAVLLLFPLAAYAEPVLLGGPLPIDTRVRAGAQNFAAADFNRDGKRDFLLVHPGRSLSVHLGRGDGTFAPPVVTPSSDYGTHLAAGDYTGDGVPDLAISALGENVSLYIGSGDGSFVPDGPTVFLAGAGPLGFGDFTGDGRLDLISHAVGANTIMVWPRDAQGGFLSPRITLAGETLYGAGTIESADFDRDGRLDAVVTGTGVAIIARGNGDGTFGNFARVPGDTFAAVGDFNSDGRPDLATGDRTSSPELYLTISRPDGTFPWQAITSGVGTEALAAADMNGDGVADLVSTSPYSAELAVMISRNDGTFAPPRTFLSMFSLGLDLADYDGDGDNDALSATLGLEGGAWLVPGNGDGTLDAPRSYPTRLRGAGAVSFPDLFGVRLRDVTGDGKADVVTFAEPPEGSTSFELAVLPGIGDGSFGAPVHTPTMVVSDGLTWVAEDFDDDGRTDVVLSDPLTTTLSFYAGTADGTFRPPVVSERQDHGRLVAGDFTGDGLIDVAVSVIGSTIVYPSNGNGGFGPGQPYPRHGTQAFAADLDGDGTSEIVFPQPGAPVSSFTLGVADVDHDGHPDVVEHLDTRDLFVHPGRGDGTFGTPYEIAFDGFFQNREMLAADIDGDELDDLLIGNHLLLGNGDAHLLRFPLLGGIDAADLDGNGTLDFAVETGGGSVGIVLTNVEEGLDIPTAFSVVPSHRSPRYGQEVTYRVRMAADSPYVTGGVVRLDDNGRTIGYGTIGTNGLAEIRTAFTQGSHTITATLLRSDLYAGATAPPVQHDVAKGRVTLLASGSINPSSIQEPFFIEVSLLVEGHSVLAQPTGTVRVFMDGVLIATREAQTPGVRVEHAMPVGRHVITVEYSGDANFEPATATYVQVVTPPRAAISLTVTPNQPVVQPGTPVTLTATLTPATATGTVTFFANDVALLTVPVQNGTAALTISHLRSGHHGLRAHYSGDANHGPAVSQPVPIEVAPGLPLRERRRSVRGGR